jgi:hypothetical protein
MKRSMRRQATWLAPLVCLVLWLLAPAAAMADAPGTRGEEPAPQGSAAGWSDAPLAAPFVAAPVAAPLAQEDPQTWLGRQLTTGNWVMDAGLGIASGALGTINEVLLLGLRRVVAGVAEDASCAGGFNIITCTPPELFLSANRGIGGTIARIWGALTPLAISLIGLLFTLRIGRMVAEGPPALAAEGKPLVVTFVIAVLFVKGAGQLIGVLLGALNELHQLLLGHAGSDLLERVQRLNGNLNFGAQLATLVMYLAVIGLAVKAVMRLVQLTILISVAPLMGALLMDPSTSRRFGQWFGKLLDTMLQQTAWVFFLWIGGLFYGQALGTPGTTIEEQVTGSIVATLVFGMALGGEAALAGIAGASAAPGGFVGNAVSSLASGRGVGRGARWLSQGLSRRGKSFAEAAAALGSNRTTAASSAIADPSRSVAAQRPKGAGEPGALRAEGGRAETTSLRYGGITRSGLSALIERQRDQLSPNALGQAKVLQQLRAQPPIRASTGPQRAQAVRERAGLQARLFELRVQETRDPIERKALRGRAAMYAELARTGRPKQVTVSPEQREQRRAAYRRHLEEHLASEGLRGAERRHGAPEGHLWGGVSPEVRRAIRQRVVAESAFGTGAQDQSARLER